MATRTMGTAGTTTLTAIPYPDLQGGGISGQAADFAAMNALILDDVPLLYLSGNAGTSTNQNTTQQGAKQNLMPTAFVREGQLFIPNRGVLKLFPGDWIGVDGFGWPILVSGRSIGTSTASWAHSGNTM